MIPNIPWYIVLIVVVTNFAIALAAWSIFSLAAGRSGLPQASQQRVRTGAAIFIGAWLGAALLLAPAPETLLARDPFSLTPLVPFFLIGPIAVAFLISTLSPAVRQVIAAAPLPLIIGVQVYRVVGVVFVLLLAQGQLPAHFAVPAGWGDILVGLSALLVAVALVRGRSGGRTLAIAWNVFGLLDLIVALGMGSGYLATFLAPHLGARVGPAPAMGIFPLILVPTFAVPVSVLLHLIGLGKLRREVKLGWGFEPTRVS